MENGKREFARFLVLHRYHWPKMCTEARGYSTSSKIDSTKKLRIIYDFPKMRHTELKTEIIKIYAWLLLN